MDEDLGPWRCSHLRPPSAPPGPTRFMAPRPPTQRRLLPDHGTAEAPGHHTDTSGSPHIPGSDSSAAWPASPASPRGPAERPLSAFAEMPLPSSRSRIGHHKPRLPGAFSRGLLTAVNVSPPGRGLVSLAPCWKQVPGMKTCLAQPGCPGKS